MLIKQIIITITSDYNPRQRPVLNYIADFMCKELMLIIEVDGFTHLFEEVVANDQKREAVLKKEGFTILRFADNEVLNNIHQVSDSIALWIEMQTQKSND